ncbi:MAG: hypothetical protein SAK29_18680 [Scytonema sp. PMC 1069.18]|nr:hypothetical protein [Scytonema sp. PMC 1069.18]MEC4880679.1 hypothetical protein [Scytonema sp. PMC 1070.18]
MFIKSYALILIAFASAFFPRMLSEVGFPSLINFAHLILVPVFCVFIVIQTRTRVRVYAVLELLAGLMIMLAVVVSSALVNKAGFINVVLDYLLRTEWFIFLLMLISMNLSEKSLQKFRSAILAFTLFNLILSFVQKFILRWGEGAAAPGDFITGVFVGQGAGSDVASAVSVVLAAYYFFNVKKSPLWMRIALIVAAIIHLFITDSKSSFIIYLLAFFLLTISKLKLSVKTLVTIFQYLFAIGLFVGVLYWAAHTVAPGLLTFSRDDQIQDGIDLKTSVFTIIPSFYKSSLNWLFGLGPGHTIGRLGAWMLRDYAALLDPLGATRHPASQATWDAYWASWIGPRSRLWSPFFGWAGIWGDWGLLGIASYIYILWIIWRRFCVDDASKFTLLSVPIFGLIFTQMEEPGYVIPVAAFIGLRWQEEQISKRMNHRLCNLQANTVHPHPKAPLS